MSVTKFSELLRTCKLCHTCLPEDFEYYGIRIINTVLCISCLPKSLVTDLLEVRRLTVQASWNVCDYKNILDSENYHAIE